jgi:hypothetical protein
MATHIYTAADPFDLTKLRLANPVHVAGAHFIRLFADHSPLYLQTPKCVLKQGFVTAGKKTYCDFLFNNEDAEFLTWLEHLEETSRSHLFQNRDKWFETKLEESDIENSTTPIYSHKGKFYVLRANVPTILGKISVKIFDDHENEVDPEQITDTTQVIAILEIQGIKCSVRGFQFEIEIKQMLTVTPQKMFDRCIINRGASGAPVAPLAAPAPAPAPQAVDLDDSVASSVDTKKKEEEEEVAAVPDHSDAGSTDPTPRGQEEPAAPAAAAAAAPREDATEPSDPLDLSATQPAGEGDDHPPHAVELTAETQDPDGPVEILDLDFSLGNSEGDAAAEAPTDRMEPPLQLKKRDDVYYQLYKEERAKAKKAKQIALAHYLEAKRIKTTFLMQDMSDSDSGDDMDDGSGGADGDGLGM